jgi:hypothetical protein
MLMTGIGFVVLCFGLCFAWFQLYKVQNPQPPGYGIFLESWDANNIGEFLGVSIPPDAMNLQIEGAMGNLGSFGIMPRLELSFGASPDNATNFANAFCNGVLHPGYNPLISTDFSTPSPSAVLIRAYTTIHYSNSPGVPDTTIGNRCARNSLVEEIVLDTSSHDLYKVMYRLRYEPNVNPEEYYPPAERVLPLGNTFRLYVTGLREEEAEDSHLYILSYPTICLETANRYYTGNDYYWMFHSENMRRYQGAQVSISIDGLPRQTARIADYGVLIPISNAANSDVNYDLWQYCLNEDWQAGSHAVQMKVEPLQGSSETFQWEFVVEADSIQ